MTRADGSFGEGTAKGLSMKELRGTVAGLLSTIGFQPSEHHPAEMDPMAELVINTVIEHLELEYENDGTIVPHRGMRRLVGPFVARASKR